MDKRLTDLDEIVSVPNTAWVHVVDPTDTSQHPDGSSFKAKKSNLGAGTLAGLSDVNIDTPTTGQALIYDEGTGQWFNSEMNVIPDMGFVVYELESTDLTTQDKAGIVDYINALDPSILVPTNVAATFAVTDTGQNFTLQVNGASYGDGNTPITIDDVVDFGAPSTPLTAGTFGDFIQGLAAKTTEIDADYGLIWDSVTDEARKVSFVNRKATLKAYNDTLYQTIASGSTTGVSVSFALDRVYGTIASPETGNITANLSGALLGVTNIIIHNNGSAPTFGSEFKKLSGSGSYVISSINYIYCTHINSTEIVYSINQRT